MLGNLVVASAITALQVAVLITVAVARGIHFDATLTAISIRAFNRSAVR